MSEEEQPTFELKKKSYQPPEIKDYGSFSERTRGVGDNADNTDLAAYYAGEPGS